MRRPASSTPRASRGWKPPERPVDDRSQVLAALDYISVQAQHYLGDLDGQPAKPPGADRAAEAISGSLPERGEGTLAALRAVTEAALAAATRSAGPRFFHFVTGGSTPAAPRPAISNWRTAEADVDLIVPLVRELAGSA